MSDKKARQPSKVLLGEAHDSAILWTVPQVRGSAQSSSAGVVFESSMAEDAQSLEPSGFRQTVFYTDQGVPTVLGMEEIQKQAYDEAYQEGLQAGQAAGRQEYEQQLQQVTQKSTQLQQLLDQLEQPFRNLDTQIERELVTLSIALAKQIVRRAIDEDTGETVAIVREALKVLPANARGVRVHLNPQEMEQVSEALALVGQQELGWQLVPDPSLSKGGCVIHTDTAKVDASLENRLGALIAQMMGGQRKLD